MNTKELQSIYEGRVKVFENKETKVKKYLVLLSFLRFFSFITLIASVVFVVKQFSLFRLGLSIIVFGFFIFLIIHYLKRTEILNHFKNLIKINSDEKNVLNNQFSSFSAGEKYIDRDHAYSYDLDLFGQGSLYQYLNRTITLAGRDLLAKRLINIKTNESTIKSKQEAILDLAPKIDWRHNFLATGYSCPVSNDDNRKIDFWIDKPVYFIKRIFKIVQQRN